MGYQPLNLRSFEEEAQSIVAQARAKACDVLAAAIQEAARIRDEARQEGHREGVASGRVEGLAQAGQEERARIAAETSGLSGLLEAIVRGIEGKRDELLTHAERDLVKLSISIAEKIVKSEVVAGKPVAPANVKRAIELVVRRNEIEVLLNPEDLAQVESYLPELKTRFTDLGQIQLRPTPSVTRGGCVVRTRQGVVDADLKTQLDEIERLLLG